MEVETKTPEQLREERKERVRKAQEKPVVVTPRDPWLQEHKVIVSKGPKPKGR